MLLDMQKQIVAHRSAKKKDGLESVDWRKFYQGVKDFRVGKYSLTDGTVNLEGDDGNTDQGTVEGETLVFKLGTLQRKTS